MYSVSCAGAHKVQCIFNISCCYCTNAYTYAVVDGSGGLTIVLCTSNGSVCKLTRITPSPIRLS